MTTYELRDNLGNAIDTFDNQFDARAAAVREFGPDTDINDLDSDGRSLVWRNSEDSQDDDGKRACGVIVRIG